MNIGDYVRFPDSDVIMTVKQLIDNGLVLVKWDIDNKAHEAVFARYELDMIVFESCSRPVTIT